MNREKIQQRWFVGCKKTTEEAVAEYVPATVPGGAQLDWANAHGWEDYNIGMNSQRYTGLEDLFWSYRTTLSIPANAGDKEVYFVSKGIDYEFEIRLNGKSVFYQEGMFTPVELNLTGKAKDGDQLEVLIYPAPKRKGAALHDRSEADQCCKPAVSYGWDWHPYLVVLGIWEETYLELREKNHLLDCELCYTLSEDFSEAKITMHPQIAGTGGEMRYFLYDAAGRQVAASPTEEFILENPELWWCNGQGKPTLYTYKAQLVRGGELLDEVEGRVGFRTVTMEVNEGSWMSAENEHGPCTRAVPPVTVCLNGRRIFAKGSNWVNPEIFPGTITRETYRPLLQLAKDAHMNLLRIWGGAIVNKNSFFELCDEMGLMVWQEFPLACNNYIGTEHYLKILRQEADSIILRIRRYTSLVLWCGGNELFSPWSGMTDQALAVRLLNARCYELDPHRPFFATSPLMGMGHGTYIFYDQKTDKDTFQMYAEGAGIFTAYSEFGVPSTPDVEYLKTFIPAEELFPVKPGGSWQHHHAIASWNDESWLCKDILEKYFGPAESLEKMVAQTQWLQCEGYKSIFEEARRQKPFVSMALNWCYNEPWKTAANNSIISYPALPKKGYESVRQALRPVLFSARIPRFDWHAGQEFTAELWLLNDLPQPLVKRTVNAYLQVNGKKTFLLQWIVDGLDANVNRKGPQLCVNLPQSTDGYFELILECAEDQDLNSCYRLRLYEK